VKRIILVRGIRSIIKPIKSKSSTDSRSTMARRHLDHNAHRRYGKITDRPWRNTAVSKNSNYEPRKSIRASQGEYDRAIHLPKLTKDDVDAYRCSMVHNISRELLQKGYHKSFASLTKLLREQEAEAAAAKAADTDEDWTRNMVKNSAAKLRIISERLMEVENVYRKEIQGYLKGEKMDCLRMMIATREKSYTRLSTASLDNSGSRPSGDDSGEPSRHTTFEARPDASEDSPYASEDRPYASEDSPYASKDSPYASVDSPNASEDCARTSNQSLVSGTSFRSGHYCPSRLAKVRSIFLSLGKCFEKNDGDIWLATFFYQEAIRTSNMISNVHLLSNFDGSLGALSRQRLGCVLMKRGKSEEALQAFQSYYDFSRNQSWINEDGVRCEVDACCLIARCLLQIMDEEEETNDKLESSEKAYEAARKAKDRPLEEETKIRLAKAKFDAGLFQEAASLAADFSCYITPRTPYDQILKGMEISAKVARMQGNHVMAVHHGVNWTDNAMEMMMDRSFYEACLFMGGLCNELGTTPWK